VVRPLDSRPVGRKNQSTWATYLMSQHYPNTHFQNWLRWIDHPPAISKINQVLHSQMCLVWNSCEFHMDFSHEFHMSHIWLSIEMVQLCQDSICMMSVILLCTVNSSKKGKPYQYFNILKTSLLHIWLWSLYCDDFASSHFQVCVLLTFPCSSKK
jgi:hypothetical protein